MAVRARRHDCQRSRHRPDDRLHVDLAGRFRSDQHRRPVDDSRLFTQRYRRDLRSNSRNAAALQENADAGIAQRVHQLDAVPFDHYARHGNVGAAGAVGVRRQCHPQLYRCHDVRRGAGRHLHLDLHRRPDPHLSRRRHPPGRRTGKAVEEITMASRSDAPHLPRSAPIDAYGNGGFAFAEMSHRGSLLCLPDAIWAWPVVKPDEINEVTLRRVIENATLVDTLVIGTGNAVWMPPSWLRERLRKLSVVIAAMQTGAASRTGTIMIGGGGRVAAALIAVP